MTKIEKVQEFMNRLLDADAVQFEYTHKLSAPRTRYKGDQGLKQAIMCLAMAKTTILSDTQIQARWPRYGTSGVYTIC